MATNYPSGLDTYTNPAGTDALSTGHASQHANVNDAVEAIEAELGTNPSGSEATVKARIETIETNNWVTTARIADSQVTSAKIADGTITGTDIASGTITSANITDGTIVNADLSATAAVDPSKIAQNRVTFSNANASCASSTRVLAQIGSMSASRTVTLPAANSVDAGTEIVVCDESGTVTSTNTIVIQRAGSDTVNGTTSVSIGAAYGMRRLISDGTSKWSVDGGVIRLSDVGTITSTMIADATITGTDIASGTVTSTNILDGTIVNADINASAAIDKTKISGTAVTVADTGTVTSTMIADGTITGTDIASGTVTSTNILDGTIVNADINASAAIDVSKLSGVVTSAGVGNLLTSAQATGSEAPTNGVNTNCTLSIDNTQYYQGTDSVLLTSAASGMMASKAYTVAIPAAGTYTVFCRVRTDQTVMGLIMASSGTGISYDTAKVAANSTGWTNYVSIVTATQATTLTISPTTTGTYGHPTGAGQKLWLDTLGVWQGTGGLWSLPGTPIANLGTYTDESVGRRIFTWDTVNSRWNLTWSDTGWRSISVWDAAGTVTGDALNTGWVPRTGVAGGIFVRRRNDVVSVRIAQLQSNATDPSGNVYTLPAGFRPTNLGTGAVNHYVPVMVYTVGGASATYALNPSSNGAFTAWNVNDWVSGDRILSAECSWMTTDAWPTTNPGSANGTIPYA